MCFLYSIRSVYSDRKVASTERFDQNKTDLKKTGKNPENSNAYLP